MRAYAPFAPQPLALITRQFIPVDRTCARNSGWENPALTLHTNAARGPKGRAEMVRRVAQGHTAVEVAADFGVVRVQS
jgi:hypothetical protein